MKTIPFQFYDEPIEVMLSDEPALEKKPRCPKGFIWREKHYLILEVTEEWIDFQRRGKMARNMTPEHLSSANIKGSWGVGRFNFRVKTDSAQIFDIYYDRAPKNVDNRKGNWFILGERRLVEE